MDECGMSWHTENDIILQIANSIHDNDEFSKKQTTFQM